MFCSLTHTLWPDEQKCNRLTFFSGENKLERDKHILHRLRAHANISITKMYAGKTDSAKNMFCIVFWRLEHWKDI